MRPGQQNNNKRMRGRGRKGPNPLSRSYESNGPDVKIRGTAQHIAERYATLARDATSAGDRVMAENYFQHAEHYGRIVAAAQGSFQPSQNDRDFDGDEDEGEEGGEFAPNGHGQPRADNRDHRQDGGQPFRERGDRDHQNRNRNDGSFRDRNDGQRERGEGGQREFRNDRGENRERNRDFNRNERRDHGQGGGERQGEERAPRAERGERRFEDRPRRFEGEGHRAAPEAGEAGAPAKDASPVTAETGPQAGDEAAAPRRRGRPPRVRLGEEATAEVPSGVSDSPASVSANVDPQPEGEAEAPRRRGRPPRSAAPAETTEAPAEAADAPVKRRPGRPRKVKPEDDGSGGEGESQLPAFLLASNG